MHRCISSISDCLGCTSEKANQWGALGGTPPKTFSPHKRGAQTTQMCFVRVHLFCASYPPEFGWKRNTKQVFVDTYETHLSGVGGPLAWLSLVYVRRFYPRPR